MKRIENAEVKLDTSNFELKTEWLMRDGCICIFSVDVLDDLRTYCGIDPLEELENHECHKYNLKDNPFLQIEEPEKIKHRFVILYRTKDFEEQELEFAQKYFFCTKHISDIKPGDIVIPRYSCLPFYKEIEEDITKMGGKILNTYKQHRYVADLSNYYNDLEELTPKTWFHLDEIPEQGPFILKGETNSKKFCWDTMMFARNKEEAIKVYLNLVDDALVGEQNIYIRKFEKLHTYTIAPRGLPITKEFRFFILYGKVIAKAFYWGNYSEELKEKGVYPDANEVPEDLIQKTIDAVNTACDGYVVDFWQKEDGTWLVGELNDLQMSGISDIDPEELYKNMLEVLKEKYNDCR